MFTITAEWTVTNDETGETTSGARTLAGLTEDQVNQIVEQLETYDPNAPRGKGKK